MSSPETYKQIIFAHRPPSEGRIQDHPRTFTLATPSLSSLVPTPEQALIRVTHISLDPAMRGWMKLARSYIAPVQEGEVMRAAGVGYVVQAGEKSGWRKGEWVTGVTGMQEYLLAKKGDPSNLRTIVPPPGTSPIDYLNALGPSGLTAYFGLIDICRVQPGESLVVSGAAGSVGLLACQIGIALGATVYAIAGTPEKCAYLEREVGVKKALNYKSPTFVEDVRKEIGYYDCFFDNVGGTILDTLLLRMKPQARIALCGAISQYNAGQATGLRNYLSLIGQRGTLRGFIVFDYTARYPEALEFIGKRIKEGRIRSAFHVMHGLENAPEAINVLFDGGNTGKLVVKIGEDPSPSTKL